MVVSEVNTSTFISDTAIFTRNNLLNITDPISAKRSGDEKFVMTDYPLRPVKYPIITVKQQNFSAIPLGMQSKLKFLEIFIEVRVWARNVKEKDELTQNVINQLNDTEFGVGGTILANLNGFNIISAVNVDEPTEQGRGGIRSKVINLSYSFILGQ